MKKTLLIILALTFCKFSLAQNFLEQSSYSVNGTKVAESLIDLDNSASPDLFYFSKTDTSIVANVVLGIDSLRQVLELNFSNLNSTIYSIGDLDNNNLLDVATGVSIDSVDVIAIFYQTSPLIFSEPEVVDTLVYTNIDVYDINRDGSKNIISSSIDSLFIYENDALGNWELIEAQPIAGITNWSLFDTDNEGLDELILNMDDGSGVKSQLFKIENSQLINSDTLDADESLDLPDGITKFSYADHNLDGKFDTYLINQIEEESSISIIVNDSLIEINRPQEQIIDIFSADFNSDGRVDILTYGRLDTEESFIQTYFNLGNDEFITSEIIIQDTILGFNIFDLDYDGDLDFITRTVHEDSTRFTVYDNATPTKNIGPSVIPEHIAFVKFDGVVIVWEDADDDFTLSQSINNDIFIGSSFTNSEIVSPYFDLLNNKRLRAIRGNSGLRNEYDLNRELSSDIYSYGIQSIDNSLHYLMADGSGNDGGGGMPLIAYGQFIVCDSLFIEELILCEDETIEYKFDSPTYVYSEKDGYLGRIEDLLIGPNKNDTLYIATPNSLECEDYRAIVVRSLIIEDLLPDEVITTCFGSLLEIELDVATDSVFWTNPDGLISDSTILSFSPPVTDSIFVEAFKNSCVFKDSILINVQPPYDLANLEYTIDLGESVRIQTGLSDLQEIVWNPTVGLNDNSPNPVATPIETTLYSLTALDSIGCELGLDALVNVISRGVIPNLFTPNSDGNNDRLLVYGLSGTLEFNLSIYNRHGSLVYETNDPNAITTIGWNGSWQGKEQPNGPYYWKVAGKYENGEEILLNGQKEGVVHLMR